MVERRVLSALKEQRGTEQKLEAEVHLAEAAVDGNV